MMGLSTWQHPGIRNTSCHFREAPQGRCLEAWELARMEKKVATEDRIHWHHRGPRWQTMYCLVCLLLICLRDPRWQITHFRVCILHHLHIRNHVRSKDLSLPKWICPW